MSYDDKVLRLVDEAKYRYGNDTCSIASFLRKQSERAMVAAQAQYDERVFEVYQTLSHRLLEASNNYF